MANGDRLVKCEMSKQAVCLLESNAHAARALSLSLPFTECHACAYTASGVGMARLSAGMSRACLAHGHTYEAAHARG